MRGTPVLKPSNKEVSKLRLAGRDNSPPPNSSLKLESPASIPILKRHSGANVLAVGVTTVEDYGKPDLCGGSLLLSRSTTPHQGEEYDAPDVQPEEPIPRAFPITPARGEPQRIGVAHPRTPSRQSVDRTTPFGSRSSREDTDELLQTRRKCQLLETERKFDRDHIELLNARLEQALAGKDHVENSLLELKSHYAEQFKKLSTRTEEGLMELAEARAQYQASAIQNKHCSDEVPALRSQVRDAIAAAEPALATITGPIETRTTLVREIYNDCEQLNAEHKDQTVRQQQTIDLLREELSISLDNYARSLEREKEGQSTLIALQESHTHVAKCLRELHEQHDLLNAKHADLRVAENGATRQAGALEEEVASLKTENAETKTLLADNEKAFSQKLTSLEEENEGVRSSLAEVHKELNVSKSSAQELRTRLQALQSEKEELARTTAALERELILKTESLDEARTRNVALEQRVSDDKRTMDGVCTENSHIKGRLVEIEKATSTQIHELSTALKSSREREDALKQELAKLNARFFELRDKLGEAEVTRAENRALESALSEKKISIEHLNLEISRLESQIAQTELTRDGFDEECRALHEANCAAREREAMAQKEVEHLRDLVKECQNVADEAKANAVNVEAELKQVKSALVKEQESHQAAEKKLEASVLSLNKLHIEHKTALDKASAAEKASRLSTDKAQEQIKQLKSQNIEHESELKRLHRDLSASISAKATLEELVVEFRSSIQQVDSSRDKLQAQEAKIATLVDQISNQKAEIRLLEQQLANSDAQLSEHKADGNTHRVAAEAARASATALETRLKQKEQEVESIRAELHALQSQRVEPSERSSEATSVLQEKIEAQDAEIKNLKSAISTLKKSAETILERYKAGHLSDVEKDLVGTITAGIVQEKNRAVNNLRGEIKRKETEIETHKVTIADLKDSLAKQIKQTAALKAELASNTSVPDDPSGWQIFNNKNMTVSSSPLSDSGSHAPDHDEPAPDTPILPERQVGQTARTHEQPQSRVVAHTRQKNQQQYRAFAQMNIDSGSAVDDIQDFEEPESVRDPGSTSRKRHAGDAEQVEVEAGERDTKRKSHGKAKKGGKAQEEANTATRQPLASDAASANTRAKATKRRKV